MAHRRERTADEITDILERTARGELSYKSAMRSLSWGYSRLVVELERRGLGGVRNLRAKGPPAVPAERRTPSA